MPGYEPSGELHLGHLLTAYKLIDLQSVGADVIVLLADLHAYLNEKGTMDQIRDWADHYQKCFSALGLAEGTRFVRGSDYQLEPEYTKLILKLARHTTLNRARRSMDEVSRNAEDPVVSQIIYPLMQTADIGYLNIDIAVGGIDQRKIHMLAREELHSWDLNPLCASTRQFCSASTRTKCPRQGTTLLPSKTRLSPSRGRSNPLIARREHLRKTPSSSCTGIRLSPIQARRARATPKVRRLDLLRGLLRARAGLRRRQASPAGSQKRRSDVCRRNHRAYS